MGRLHLTLWRCLALAAAMAVVAVALSACGSSSSSSGSSSSEGSRAEKATGGGAVGPASETEEAEEPQEAEEESESGESELEGIMRIQIYGKFGGNHNEFDVGGGTCKIVKINTTPAEVKAGGEAVLDHERNASVLAKPAGGVTMKECENALESAIG